MRLNGMLNLSLLCSRTDEEAMCRVAQHDDHQEFARLVRRWEEPIGRLCARMIGDPDRAKDLRQDTFLRLFEKRKDYRPTGRVSTFLWRIALNRCYDELRRQQRRRELPAEDGNATGTDPVDDHPVEGPGPDWQTVELEEGELVRQAVLRLPDIYRAV